ncbi:preprotein translocase, auxillary membrane component (General Secretory Pathway) [Candidatus Competibacter denitrificans Run_A_D11]|uniref:Protein-export membrane protein SecF n=1 Tax=Candidatus Competibacter denitrificans Run_A_D11 TaxID=1400863 RepID=W6M701_9GAMM|nr:protein translocase subunit SecF [Candidatus Competibacter denitrificans]CDI01485.1 preprotein translocase, auxillary membrane component (General Secretory Pathway) [Candidatus Competibacter denitrificans Run_A_D11]HAS85497.1 protein translocase subunit SecF [Candidatus Competibacteraceae bacterium]HRC68545.1 protein translocase subunit SecF [Candidatus Competibacter denitrificans]
MWRFSLYNTNIDFLRWRKLAMIWSVAVLLIAIMALLVRGMNLGLDFTGGTVLEVQYPQPVEIPQIRDTLAKAGFPDAQTQHFGTSRDVLIRIPPHAEQSNAATLSNSILHALQAAEGGAGASLARAEFVGPQVGQELVEQGGLAALGALAGILIYVMFRFEWRLAVGTIAATVHDVLFTIGWFSLFQIEFDLTVLAAVLAVIGYSVNDTVVVLDRIRENFRKRRKGSAMEIMNLSINETLSRTIMTSFVTLLSVIVMYFFGGSVMRGFSIAMIIGIVVGTYSSIYIASATALYLGISREDLLPRAKETADDHP